MKTCECTQCGASVPGMVWGFGLLAMHGWSLTPETHPHGAAERSWLCAQCTERQRVVARALSKLTSSREVERLEREVERERTAAHTGLRVLVVDDQALMRRSLVRLLDGCEVVSAASPSEAVAVLQSGTEFDAIVCDVMMPEMSGPELYARCHARWPEIARRFVFASADPIAARLMILDAAASVGAESPPVLLKKPTTRVALLAAVSAVARDAGHRSGTYVLRFPDTETEEIASTEAAARDSKAG